ncbi:MAG: hypothetical protein PVF33_10310 [Candidatus Latescibacterota bacterium]|jgi:hypothetical protein
MEHTIEPAASGRAGCRGCGNKIARGELRFGERLPNPFADGTVMTHWFHLRCAAMKRPDALLDTLADTDHPVEATEADHLREIARVGLTHRRIPRIDGVERSPSGRAACRQCREPIPKDDWRIKLVFYEEGMFNPAGFIHLTCATDYFETADIVDRLTHFTSDLSSDDLAELEKLLS